MIDDRVPAADATVCTILFSDRRVFKSAQEGHRESPPPGLGSKKLVRLWTGNTTLAR